MAQGPKFCFLLSRSFVPRPTEYTCQVSLTLGPAVSGLSVLNLLTPRRRTDIWPVL